MASMSDLCGRNLWTALYWLELVLDSSSGTPLQIIDEPISKLCGASVKIKQGRVVNAEKKRKKRNNSSREERGDTRPCWKRKRAGAQVVV